MMSELDFTSLRSILEQLFQEADVEGSGQLALPEVMTVGVGRVIRVMAKGGEGGR